MKTGSGKKKMRLGLGLVALGVSIVILGSQGSKDKDQKSSSSVATESVSYRSIQKQELGADVVEFFWYGCPHCLRLEQSLHDQSFHEQVSGITIVGQYKASFIRVPAVLNDEWALDARLFYALDSLGMSDDGHIEIMSIIESNRPKTRSEMLKLLADTIIPSITKSKLIASTLSPQELDLAMFSPSVDSHIQDSIEKGRSIKLTGVPVMVVGGEKVVSLGADATYETMSRNVLSLLRQNSQ